MSDSTPAAYLNQLGLVCALGDDLAQIRRGAFTDHPGGLSECTAFSDTPLQLGQVHTELADLHVLPIQQRSRNNALLLTALAQIRSAVDTTIAHFGAHRIAVVLGTSTSGIAESELAIAQQKKHGRLPPEFDLAQQEIGSPAIALSGLLKLTGPAYVISTACSSSAKSLASAARLLQLGVCDAVLCGGVDTLCKFTVSGFSALDSISATRCNPFSVNRCGINIGEGAALFLMTRELSKVRLAGWGECSDAHHISAPQPSGAGALRAMQLALARAQISPEQIDYVNLHGTATPQNDAMEALAANTLFGAHTPMSSTKPLTGHTLGAAGAIEAALCYLSLTQNPRGKILPHWWDGSLDPNLAPLHLAAPGLQLDRPLNYVLSNSFAFGGSNCSLVLARHR
jgi:3-oxoacyl-[acyl-carrier-protein] synthase-1